MKLVLLAAIVALVLAGCGSAASNPAATVNGHTISMGSFDSEFNMQRMAQSDKYGYDVCALKQLAGACTVIKRQSLTTLVDNEIIREYASRHSISVSGVEAAQQWMQVYNTQFHGQQAVVNAFLKRVHVSESAYRTSLKNDQLQQKVLYAVTANAPTTGPAVRIAHLVAVGKKDLKDVQYLLRHGTAFGTVIAHLKVVSVHGCKVVQCGDLGWVPYDFVPPNRRMLETAHNYAIVGPLAGQGYWDFYLVEAHNPKYVLSARQLYTRRTLLFQKWLQRQEHRANVKRYVAA